MNKNPICIMSCGCRIPLSELVEVVNTQTCPNHPEGRIVVKEFVCASCGKAFKASKQASSSLYCPPCRKEKILERNRNSWAKHHGKDSKNNKKPKYTSIDYEKASVEMAFCKKRSECLKTCTASYLPCLRCEHFRDPDMLNSL